MKTKAYKVGILGLSMGGNWAEGIARNKDARLVALYDPDLERARTVGARYGIVPAATEDEFFDTDLDIVVVASPDHLHVRQAVRALSLGRHVACEKPMAPTVKDCRAIAAAVRRSGKVFVTGQLCRFRPDFVLAKKLVEQGRIGDIAFIESQYYHDYSRVPGVNNWRKDSKIRREGFIGGGCHAMDLIRWIAGDPQEVFCYMNQKFLTDWPTKDTGVAVMKFKSGAIGKVFVSIGVKAGYSMQTVIHGTQGSIFCDHRNGKVKLWLAKGRDKPVMLPVRTMDRKPVYEEFKEFVECLKAGRRPMTDEIEGANTVAFGEACLESARTGKPVRVRRIARKEA